ncbi:hypothetical protein HOR75_gp63 [Shewanella phage SppYZU05]|uniref:Uncharacterized protein n=1 Tax=Shewanella phage SppYZU05 TaxID=1970795 RepID=A0A1W6JTJ0_9CAUD|nr:hypothetical protein HOR75_gp63 [Shewanella phage SppYZU05]ARM70589.1 hypothetical protein SppYZU05_63 [Shewanella phage SppYZU05]
MSFIYEFFRSVTFCVFVVAVVAMMVGCVMASSGLIKLSAVMALAGIVTSCITALFSTK